MGMKITEALLAEHAVFHNVFDHVERIVPRLRSLAEVRTVAELLETLLEAHSKVEDELILEPLAHAIEQLGQEETFLEEHQEIDRTLRLALKSRDLRTARRFLQAAVLSSRNHFDKEERVIFPMAEKLLKGKTLSTLGDRWMRERKLLGG